ncbi:Ig-like domain (group 3), partial [Variovorax sp. PDC80]
ASRVLSVSRLANAIDVTPLLNGADVNLGVDPTTLGGIALSLDNAEPVPAGRATLLTATAEGAPSGSMVTFFDGETVIGSAVLVDGKASLVTDRLSVGTHSLRVAFAGDMLRPASVSKAVKKVITPAVIAAEIRYQSPTPGSAEPLTLSLVLSADSGWLVPQSGKVAFYNGSELLGEAYVANGVASLVLQSWPSGKLNVRAEYSGDTAHTSAVALKSFVPVPPSVALTVSSIRVTNGGPITLRAEVSGRKSGVVAFYAGKISLGTVDVIDGVATLAVDFLQMGSYALSATYSDRDESFSGVLTQGPSVQVDVMDQSNVGTFDWGSVNRGDYYTGGDYWNYQLYINAGPWQIDGQVQVGTVPQILVWDNSKSKGTSGTYAIFVDDVLVGSVVHWAGKDGIDWDRQFSFALPVNLLPSKGHRLAIVYNRRVGYQAPSGNTSEPGLVVNTVLPIDAAPTAATVSVSPARAPAGAPVTLSTKISMALPYDVKGTPSSDPSPIGGLVKFYANGVVIGSATVVNGQASLVVSNLPQGTNTITARYEGDGSYLPSESTAGLSVQITPPAVTLTNLTTPTIAQDGGLSVRVAGQTPTGLVSFYSGTTLLGTVAVREDGTATLRGVPIPAGTHTFSAVYSGDSLNADG